MTAAVTAAATVYDEGPPVGQLVQVGVSHHRAALTLLERLVVRRGEAAPLVQALREAGCTQLVLLSTCGRTEVYAGLAGDLGDALRVLAGHGGLTEQALRDVAEVRIGPPVVRHLFRVACGLESRVVGEVDILGQVRAAFRASRQVGLTGRELDGLFTAALRCAGQVHRQTALGERGRSLARQAVDLGLARAGGPHVLVVGSGRMAGTAVEHLASRGHRARVCARDDQAAGRLTGPAPVLPLADLADGIAGADLLLCTTSAAAHVVTLADVRRAMHGRARPLTVVDLSVPRNVDPRIGELAGVHLLDVAALEDGAHLDPALARAVVEATELVEAAVQRHQLTRAALAAGPVITALRREIEHTCRQELGQLDAELAGRLTHALTGKLAHPPTVLARAAVASGDTGLLHLLGRLYGPRPQVSEQARFSAR